MPSDAINSSSSRARLTPVALASWSDASLIEAMRQGEEVAWRAFGARFKPLLEAHARKARIPRWEWTSCIGELLNDEAMRFARPDSPPPADVAAYLMRAVANRYLCIRRASASRDRRDLMAAEERRGELVVLSSCSEHALQTSNGAEVSATAGSGALRKLVCDLRTRITPQDEAILVWISKGVSHRRISLWLGVSHAAAAKRIWRLRRRLRTDALARAASYAGEDRRDVERFFRRAGVTRAEMDSSRPRAIARNGEDFPDSRSSESSSTVGPASNSIVRRDFRHLPKSVPRLQQSRS